MSVCQFFKICRPLRRRYVLTLLISLLPLLVIMRTVMRKEECGSLWGLCLPPPQLSDIGPISVEIDKSDVIEDLQEFKTDEALAEDLVERVPPLSGWRSTLETVCTGHHPGGQGSTVPQECEDPLITMFTSMQVSEVRRKVIHSNTIINWSSLGSCVELVLYVKDINSSFAHFALRRGWIIEKIPFKLFGIPVLKTMFLRSFNTTSTALYLYANADILFDFGLIRTSLALLCASRRSNTTSDVNKEKVGYDVTNSVFDTGIFAVGRRTNIALTSVSSSLPMDLSKQCKSGGHLFVANAQDYFITTAGGGIRPNNNAAGNSAGHFNWDRVPRFVIGRPGYDNWLVTQAIKWNVSMSIDLTTTVLAVHQTGADGVHSGFTTLHNRPTLRSNYNLAGGRYNYNMGVTGCLRWLSVVSPKGDITFITRQFKNHTCTNHERRKVFRKWPIVERHLLKKPVLTKTNKKLK